MRKPGFYWVRRLDGEWQPAQWDGEWFLLGCDMTAEDKHLEAIGPEITPPLSASRA